MFDVEDDPGESHDVAANAAGRPAGAAGRSAPDVRDLLARIERISGAEPSPTARPSGGDAASRLGSLGYVQGGPTTGSRPDPKDRRALAARIAAVTSAELQGDALLGTLEAITREDPRNGQMQLRLGDELVTKGRFADAARHFAAAIDARLPSADPYLGLAACQAQAGKAADAIATLRSSQTVESGNPVVLANLGLLFGRQGQADAATSALRQALEIDPDFHEARFNFVLALARAGRKAEARAEAGILLGRLPSDAPQRSEVERLLSALR